MRILIVGTSGTGKTTFAKKISQITGIKYTDLDDLFWLADWKERQPEEFFNLASKILSERQWILTGNYNRLLKNLLWQKANLLIWLDYSLRIALWRAFKRGLKRGLTKEVCCNNNIETLSRLFGPKSILLWIFKTHRKRKKNYIQLIKNNHFEQLKIVRLKTPKETEIWLKKFEENFYLHEKNS